MNKSKNTESSDNTSQLQPIYRRTIQFNNDRNDTIEISNSQATPHGAILKALEQIRYVNILGSTINRQISQVIKYINDLNLNRDWWDKHIDQKNNVNVIFSKLNSSRRQDTKNKICMILQSKSLSDISQFGDLIKSLKNIYKSNRYQIIRDTTPKNDLNQIISQFPQTGFISCDQICAALTSIVSRELDFHIPVI